MRSRTITSIVCPPAVAALCVAALAVPRLLPGLLALCGLAAAAALVSRHRGVLRRLAGNHAVIALFVFAAYLFVNSTWALNRAAAVEKSGLFLLLAGFAAALAAFIATLGNSTASRTTSYCVFGVLAGAAFLAEEYLFHMPVLGFAVSHFPQLGKEMVKEIVQNGPRKGWIESLVYNRNMAIAALLLVPVLLACDTFANRTRKLVCAALAVLLGVNAWFTASGTAVAALAVGIALLALGRFSERAARWLVVGGWVAGLLLAVPLGALPAKLGALDWDFLPQQSAQARFYIWSYTANKVKERPFTGIGVRATRELQPPDVPLAEANSNTYRYKPRPGRHAHNAFLQIWLELGAIGAVLLLAFGLAGLRAMARLPEREAVHGYALFASICTVASLGYGIWQTWLLSGFALAILLYLLAVHARRLAAKDAAPDQAPASHLSRQA